MVYKMLPVTGTPTCKLPSPVDVIAIAGFGEKFAVTVTAFAGMVNVLPFKGEGVRLALVQLLKVKPVFAV